jgi:hypothetical protein
VYKIAHFFANCTLVRRVVLTIRRSVDVIVSSRPAEAFWQPASVKPDFCKY